MSDILRGERLDHPSQDAIKYTSSISSDKVLLTPVIKINKAHLVMLVRQGIIKLEVGALCLEALDSIPRSFKLDPKLEDVHMNIEKAVTEKVGKGVGGNLHVAKSRNDQVATAIRLALRERILNIALALIQLRKVILNRCLTHLNAIMPGYTHGQHAQPVTLAHHLLAHHDAFKRDTKRLMEAYNRVNLSPMGAAALATTGFKIDREMVAEFLGFDGLIENSIDAVSTRDFAIEVISDLALTMTDLSRMAEELILWSTAEFAIVDFPGEYASTSSIMPQKKNPVVAELVRAKTSHVYANLFAAFSIVKALPYSYNLDLQELTPHLWEACYTTISSIEIMTSLLEKVKFNTKRLAELLLNDMSTATELADTFVRELKIPFRSAHKIVGVIVRRALTEKRRGVTLELVKRVLKEHVPESQISNEKLQAALDPYKNVQIRNVIGGPAPGEVSRMLRLRNKEILADEDWCAKKTRRLEEADLQLALAVNEINKIANASDS